MQEDTNTNPHRVVVPENGAGQDFGYQSGDPEIGAPALRGVAPEADTSIDRALKPGTIRPGSNPELDNHAQYALQMQAEAALAEQESRLHTKMLSALDTLGTTNQLRAAASEDPNVAAELLDGKIEELEEEGVPADQIPERLGGHLTQREIDEVRTKAHQHETQHHHKAGSGAGREAGRPDDDASALPPLNADGVNFGDILSGLDDFPEGMGVADDSGGPSRGAQDRIQDELAKGPRSKYV